MSPDISRRRVLQWVGSATAITAGATLFGRIPAFADGLATLSLVDNGAPQAVIIYPNDADPQQLNGGAGLIQRSIGMISGAQLLMAKVSGFPDPHRGGRAVIWVDTHPEGRDAELRKLIDPDRRDGYAIEVSEDEVLIVGLSTWGARFGCQAFCTEMLGVRWLMPKDLGEDFTARLTIIVPVGTWHSDPQMITRTLYPFEMTSFAPTEPPEELWAHRHRVHWAINQNHGLGRLLDDPDIRAQHPEIFPIHGGVRFIPAAGQYIRWQPRFSSPELVDVVVPAVIAYFDQNPDEDQYSLAVNDGSGYSDDELPGTGYNSLGLHHMSELYFRFVNAVIDGVNRLRPDLSGKKYGVLAYQEVLDPPSFPVRGQAVVFVARERTWRSVPTLRSADNRHLRSWAKVAPSWGIYDYVYGSAYAIPRIQQDVTADLYRTVGTLGATAAFAEWLTTWNEGPKASALLALMWDTNFDVTKHDAEWYARTAGDGAGDLAAYYQVWTDIWTQRMPSTDWFQASVQLTYGRVDHPGYLDAVTTADLHRASAHLDAAIGKARTPEQQFRLNIIKIHHAYTDATVRSYPQRVARPGSDGEAVAIIDDVTTALSGQIAAAGQRAGLYQAVLHTSPGVKATFQPDKDAQSWSGWNLQPAWEVAQFLRERPALSSGTLSHLRDLAAGSSDPNVRQWCEMTLDVAASHLVNRLTNPDFSNGMADWTYTTTTTPDEPTTITTDYIQPGRQTLRLTGPFASGGLAHTDAPASPGFTRHSTWLYVPRNQTALGAAMVTWVILDASGKVIDVRSGQILPLSRFQRGWTELTHTDLLPAGTTALRCTISLFIMGRGTPLYVSGSELLQIDPDATYTPLRAPMLRGH